MDQIRRILANIGKQLGPLTVTQKLLIATLGLVVVMALALVSLYAGSPKMVELSPAATGEEQAKIATALSDRGFAYKLVNNKVMVAAEDKYPALGALAKAQALPGDKKLLLGGLVAQNNWMLSASEKQQQATIALGNELAAIIRNFGGMTDASVIISAPEARGIGAAVRKPVATVTVFPARGEQMDQKTVNALADLVAGCVAGLDAKDVAVIDGVTRRSFKAVGPQDLAASTYLEQVAAVEKRVQDKIAEQLRFIDNLIVSVNAIVDANARSSTTKEYAPVNSGTVRVTSEETTTTTQTSGGSKGPAEPGLASNVGMDVNRPGGSGGGQTSTSENGTTKYETRFGEKTVTQVDARGRPTRINVTLSVPRDYVAEIVKRKKGGAAGGGAANGGGAAGGQANAAEPSEAEITAEWDGVRKELEALVSPLLETESGSGTGTTTTGKVSATLIPIAMTSVTGSGSGRGARGASGSGGGGGGLVGSFLEGGMLKNVLMGGLAAVSLAFMFMMVRKAGKAPALPTAEELVGIPPALEPGSDVVGEADETETAMAGIEVDDDQLKTQKMLEQVGDLVKSNPQVAATVFNRWLNTEE